MFRLWVRQCWWATVIRTVAGCHREGSWVKRSSCAPRVCGEKSRYGLIFWRVSEVERGTLGVSERVYRARFRRSKLTRRCRILCSESARIVPGRTALGRMTGQGAPSIPLEQCSRVFRRIGEITPWTHGYLWCQHAAVSRSPGVRCGYGGLGCPERGC